MSIRDRRVGRLPLLLGNTWATCPLSLPSCGAATFFAPVATPLRSPARNGTWGSKTNPCQVRRASYCNQRRTASSARDKNESRLRPETHRTRWHCLKGREEATSTRRGSYSDSTTPGGGLPCARARNSGEAPSPETFAKLPLSVSLRDHNRGPRKRHVHELFLFLSRVSKGHQDKRGRSLTRLGSGRQCPTVGVGPLHVRTEAAETSTPLGTCPPSEPTAGLQLTACPRDAGWSDLIDKSISQRVSARSGVLFPGEITWERRALRAGCRSLSRITYRCRVALGRQPQLLFLLSH